MKVLTGHMKSTKKENSMTNWGYLQNWENCPNNSSYSKLLTMKNIKKKAPCDKNVNVSINQLMELESCISWLLTLKTTAPYTIMPIVQMSVVCPCQMSSTNSIENMVTNRITADWMKPIIVHLKNTFVLKYSLLMPALYS